MPDSPLDLHPDEPAAEIDDCPVYAPHPPVVVRSATADVISAGALWLLSIVISAPVLFFALMSSSHGNTWSGTRAFLFCFFAYPAAALVGLVGPWIAIRCGAGRWSHALALLPLAVPLIGFLISLIP